MVENRCGCNKQMKMEEFRMIRRWFVLALWFLMCCNAHSQRQVVDVQFQSVESTEADSVRTLQSIHKAGDLYMMTYYGEYDRRLDRINHDIIHNGFESVRTSGGNRLECSMFAAFSATALYGRNFDNPDCGVLMTLTHPIDGYASVGFSRMNDFGFNKGEDPRDASFDRKQLLLNAAFFTPDGMNERGVSVALAALPSVQIVVHEQKKSMFITCLVREILDHAGNIDEAVAIINKYNIFDSGADRVSHHLLMADPSGRSVIVEYAEKEWKVIPQKTSWQAITNTPLWDRSEETRKDNCWRYEALMDGLTGKQGKIDWQEGMDLLKRVSVNGTQWSTICDMKSKEIYISLYKDFNHIQRIRLPDFD